ncbi:RNA polymerase sigma factor [Parafilimonas terrae]|jgi:RNA polymerase sigma-70 factor (ECF subfamily)|uniref:RNA polymerase sigma-70 factor, ECF subfamily n=1 Tax=Parafilimonas terrae TaxID=1465490 RepID=A0A1I5YZZ8_9BACT|nr:sigma-70 family RNA polymerase sigma factor [Parafilimonas terrae]SFQ49806.1 RNA polymerase sigma-70 factor, ECF subfamily [Parafilimonas terrae]
MNTKKLVKEAKRGIEASQKCLFDQFNDRLMLICYRYLKNRQDAEEALLDGFHKFFKSLSSFQYNSEAQLYVWLKKIIINECLMMLRKKNVFNIVTEDAAIGVQLEEDALNTLSAKEIFELILELPVGYRTIFNLHVIEGMNHKEIAEATGISEGTSKSQLSKAKVLLQKKLLQNGLDYDKRKIK